MNDSTWKRSGPEDSNDDNDDERDVLASIHASLQDQTVYEGQVLRKASHQLAPTISIEELGIPNNTSSLLLGHHQNHEPIVFLRSLLATTRRKIREMENEVQKSNRTPNDDDDVLYMKEQILLHVISTLTQKNRYDSLDGDDDTSVRNLTEERAAEQRRSQFLIQRLCNENGNVTAPSLPAAAAMEVSQIHAPRARVSMMKRRRLESGIANGTASANGPLTDQQRETLRNVRMERNQRKQQRRGKTAQRLPSDIIEDNNDDGNNKEEVVDLELSSEGSSALPSSSLAEPSEASSSSDKAETTNAHRASVASSTVTPSASSVVMCPECKANLDVGALLDVDTVLAQHLSVCGTNYRPRRNSSRSRSTTTVSYIDSASDAEDSSEEVKSVPTRPTRATTVRKREARVEPMSDPIYSEPPSDKIPETALSIASSSIDDMDEWAYEDRVDDWIANGLDRMKVMRERDDGEALPGSEEYDGGLLIPAWINDRLFGYQRDGLRWMWDLHQNKLAGGIIGDEMGLGKTVQVAAYLGAAVASRKLQSVLIVTPATILQHWLTELAIWAPGLRRILIHKSGGDGEGLSRSISSSLLQKLSKWLQKSRRDHVNEAIDDYDWTSMDAHAFCGTGYAIVTTYENLRRNTDVYTAHDWSYIVLDEAQKIRNPDADITLACKRIRTYHRLAMSGTPIQNDLRELWSLFDFVSPGRLGTLPTFEQEFAVPIKRGGYSNASPMQVQLAYRCAITLRDLIEPYMLRRLKKDVKEVSRMPGKTEHVLFCRLSARQRAMYEAYLLSDDVRSVLRGGTQLLAAVTMLRKIANHPDLVCDPTESSLDAFVRNRGPVMSHSRMHVDSESYDDDDDEDNSGADEVTLLERSGKLEVLAKILPLWKRQGHRVLIFCQWRKMLNIVERFTRLKNWKFGRLDGNTNIASRQRLVDSFNSDPSYFGMLCTTRTGGVGLNLIGANRCVIYDPDWNPSGDAQARERAWRFGQEKEVTVYRLITAGTIEEKIYQRQIFKTALTNKILQDPRQRRLFSQRDLRDLFTLAADTGSVHSGSDGITETSKMTRGVGVVDAEVDLTNENDDNEVTLKNVLKSKGLAGIFDHHSVEPDHKRKSTTAREMEEQAKRVAKEAVNALKESITSNDQFVPTWTGSDETKPEKFRPSRPSTSTQGRPTSTAISSSDLLASLRQRNAAVESGGQSETPETASLQYSRLLDRLKAFVRRERPSTEEILKEFENVPDTDGAVFRQLLKSIASIENGRWSLTERA